jgi:amino acid transporter
MWWKRVGNQIRKKGVSALALLLVFVVPRIARAQDCPGGLCNPLTFQTLDQFLVGLLGLIIQIGFPVVVLFIVFIGFRFVQHSAEGNAEKLAEDRKLILWAFVGALILLGAQALAFAIQATVEDLSTGL